MADKYSFIDNDNRDFLRDENGEVIVILCDDWQDAEDWLLSEGEEHGWTNTGIKYFNWSEEFGD
jgi:hypothetical protein